MISDTRMNPTIELLRLIGSPFAQPTIDISSHSELKKLYDYSEKNRMLFHYLEHLRMKKVNDFSSLYQKENTRCLKITDSISQASMILTEMHIEHAVFKTIRPYKSTTVDMDVIIFGEHYQEAVKIMQRKGYSLVVQGPMSTTMWDQEANMGIDLYDQVAVSSVTYIDKRKLVDSITDTRLPNNKQVKTLKPEADLACIIAHSIIKEQLYTLAEYYTFIHYLEQMDINNFIQTVKKSNIGSATKTHATLTALLHQTAHGTVPDTLHQILEVVGEGNLEATRLQRTGFETPHKYHPITIGRSLLEITKGKETRRSLEKQLSNMFDANFANDFLRKFVNHLFRETY